MHLRIHQMARGFKELLVQVLQLVAVAEQLEQAEKSESSRFELVSLQPQAPSQVRELVQVV